MSNREFLQLAHNFDPNKHCIGGWYVSEKLDGMRAYWDGGISRGMLTSQVAYANTLKDFRRITPARATGLWTRYAKPIAAPDWFLDKLPVGVPLDGELYAGVGSFQRLISTVKKFEPDNDDWAQVQYLIFDVPSDYFMFKPGKINNPNCKLEIPDIRAELDQSRPPQVKFRNLKVVLDLNHVDLVTGPAKFHPQYELPMQTDRALDALYEMLDEVTRKGGEGLILRHPDSVWEPKRTYNLLKVKRWLDSEATVIGYVWGKGKLSGLMGALVVNWRGITFELSGFTDEERKLYHTRSGDQGDGAPGTYVDQGEFCSYLFPVGCRVTFKYRELTDAGVPKEARFWRK